MSYKSGKIYIFSQGAMLFLKLISFSHKLLLIFFWLFAYFPKASRKFSLQNKKEKDYYFLKKHKVKNINISFTSSSSEHIVGTRK